MENKVSTSTSTFNTYTLNECSIRYIVNTCKHLLVVLVTGMLFK